MVYLLPQSYRAVVMSSEHSLPDPRIIEEYWKTAFGECALVQARGSLTSLTRVIGMAFPNVPNDMTARLDELGTFPDLSMVTSDDASLTSLTSWKHPPSPVQTSASPPSVPTSPQHRNVSVKYSEHQTACSPLRRQT